MSIVHENTDSTCNVSSSRLEYGKDDNSERPLETIIQDEAKEENIKYDQLEEETQEEEAANDIEEQMKLGFVAKVYGILAYQLSITIALLGLIFIPQYEQFLLANEAVIISYISMAGGLIMIIILSCYDDIARKVPYNYLLLTLFSIFQSYLLQMICIQFEPHSVIIAGILTASVTIVLALYANNTKIDYTFCGAFLLSMLTISLISGIIGLFWKNYLNEVIMAGIGIMTYSIYLVYDIQLISQNYGVLYKIDDYIMASMNVYLDILNLFVKILRLIGKRRRR